MARPADITRFYETLSRLEGRCGYRTLNACNGRMCWPKRGVYFFFEQGEFRREPGDRLRVVRVRTHALTEGAKATLWGRLRQHKGVEAHGGGNHRGSVFRKHVGYSLMRRFPVLRCETWGFGAQAAAEIRAGENELERRVSEHIGKMPFLWLEVDDAPGRGSKRKYIEENAIALLSNFGKSGADLVDVASGRWLGKDHPSADIVRSGLWNSDHVKAEYSPSFLHCLDDLVSQMLAKCPCGPCAGKD